MTSDIQAAQAFVSHPVGMLVSEARLGSGSFLFVRFLSPTPSPGEDCELWTYQCAWRLDSANGIFCGSEDDRSFIGDAVTRLGGSRLLAFDVTPTCDATIRFAGPFTLRLFPIYSRGYEHWMLWRTHQVLTAGPGTSWSTEERTGEAVRPGPGQG